MSENKQCPKCVEVGHDLVSKDHLWLMKDGITWCCNKPYHEIYYEGKEGKKIEEKERGSPATYNRLSIREITKLPYESIRSIPKAFIKYYGIRCSFNGSTGEVDTHYYPIYNKKDNLISYKKRELPKKFSVTHITEGKDVQLFGQHLFKNKNRRVLVTEGELDAVASAYMLKKYKIPCVSLPFGANSKALSNNLDFLSQFDYVYLHTDQDEAGQEILKEMLHLLPEARVVTTKLKDACDMLADNRQAEFVEAFWAAKKYKPDFAVPITDLVEDAISPVEWGLTYPYPSLTKALYGARLAEVTAIGAGPGSGKSTVIQQITNHFIFEHKAKVAILSLEETPSFTLKKYIGSLMNKPIHLPDTEYDIEEARYFAGTLTDCLYIYNHMGSYRDWGDIIRAVRYYHNEGVRYFVIDPLSALVAHLSASDGNEYLNNAIISMSALAQELEISWYHINHLNNPKGGADHGEGGRVKASQFSGSRSQWKYSNNVIGLERDQQAEDEDIRNSVVVRILKNRLSGDTPSFNLSYDKDTGKLYEPKLTIGGNF